MMPEASPAAAGVDIELILRDRARALAQPAQAAGVDPRLEVLEFELAGERYGIETCHVLDVQPLRNLTPLPCTPAFVAGVVNIRGRIFPVLDLKKFFGLPDRGLTDLHRVVVVGDGDVEFGVLADMDVGVRAIAAAAVRTAPATIDGPGAEYLKGVTADRLVVLDMAAIFADPRILVDDAPDPLV